MVIPWYLLSDGLLKWLVSLSSSDHSPSRGLSVEKGVSTAFRPLAEFLRKSGRDDDTDTADDFLLHFSTGGNSSCTGNTSGTGNSSCPSTKTEHNQ